MALHHALTLRITKLPTLESSPTTVQVSAVQKWTSTQNEAEIIGSEKSVHAVIKVSGKIEEYGVKVSRTWEFEWDEPDLKKMEDILTLIRSHLTSDFRPYGLVNNACGEVCDWLTIGFSDDSENKSNSITYALFSKDGQTMRAEFKNYDTLLSLRSAINQVRSLQASS